MASPPRTDGEPEPELAARSIGRLFFGTTAGAALVSAAILGTLPAGIGTPTRGWLVAAIVAFALLCGALAHLSAGSRRPLDAALAAVALAAMALAGTVAALLGDGVRSVPLGFCGLIVCVVGAITRPRIGIALGVLAALGLGLLAGLEGSGVTGPAPGATPLALALAFQTLVVACGSIGGALIARVLHRTLHAAAEREQRFRGLLRIAADWYWEQDRTFRFTRVARADGADDAAPIRPGAPAWDPMRAGLDDETLDAYRADLEAHHPFSGLRVRCRDGARMRTISVSGAPQFDAGGAFTGYWGVARDVTDEAASQQAIAASETRYRELFARSPSPLLLHRRGVVFDANEAAARLFGVPDTAALHGLEVAGLFPPGPMRERVGERVALLDALPLGEGLPVVDYTLRATDGRPLSVQATAVRVDTVSGPANLSIFYDISARKAAEGALRRSEAMLSHLFATSPDCIALTEVATGRFAMVNPAFCRLTRYRADEVVGRTGAELGLWLDPQQPERLLQQLGRDGSGTVLAQPAVFVSKSGALVSMLVTAGRFAMDRHDYLVVNARDVTESERTRLQHGAILERASIGIAFTRDGRFVQANPFFERMLGWAPGTLIGESGAVVWPSDAEHREIGALASPLLAAGQPFEVERRLQRRDGSRFWCRLLGQAVDRLDPARGGTIWIAEDVTERRRLDAALAAARDAAEAASRAKSAFLANTSHEIRTPLNGLLGLARLALRDDQPEARRREYLAQIVDSAQALAGIMSDVLDVSRIEAGKLTLDATPFDLRETLVAVHHAYDSLAEVKGLALRLVIDDTLPATVRGDPVRVRQILSNFITNALKFTERGEVRIEAERGDGYTVRLAVVDTGPGVDDDTQALLFKPFSQGDSSTTRRFGGTGLGLSICRELAQLMGGAVGVDSQPGAGSTFWAELPLPGALPSARPPDDDVAPASLAGLHVLMAEDNPVNMMIGVAMLEHWGVRVAQAGDGRAAVAAVHAAARAGEPFDAVLMDVQMPVMGGHEAARELRRHFDAAELPIVALTAAALVSEREAALAAGMDAFLTKPVDAGKLRATLAALVPRRTAAAPDAGGYSR